MTHYITPQKWKIATSLNALSLLQITTFFRKQRVKVRKKHSVGGAGYRFVSRIDTQGQTLAIHLNNKFGNYYFRINHSEHSWHHRHLENLTQYQVIRHAMTAYCVLGETIMCRIILFMLLTTMTLGTWLWGYETWTHF